jgi:hypothetical protein
LLELNSYRTFCFKKWALEEMLTITTAIRTLFSALSSKCVEEEKAKNRELINEALDLEDDLVALQDAAVESNRYKCQVEDLEKEMERSRKDYKEEIVKLEQQIEDLYKIQMEDTQQTKPRSTMTSLESGMLEQLQDKILDMELWRWTRVVEDIPT